MKRNTANQILDAATPLFASFGFRNVTVDQLAKAANVNGAAIIYYFGSKESLYREVLKRQFSPALQTLQEMDVSFTTTATERLLDYAKVMVAIQDKQPYLTILWQYEMHYPVPIQNNFCVKEYTLQLYQHIASVLCHGISQNEILPDLELYATAFVLLEMMHALSIPVLLLTEPGLSGVKAGKNYTLQAVCHYLQGIRRL